MNDEEKLALLERLTISLNDFQHALSASTFLLEELDDDEDKRYPIEDLRRMMCFETALVVSFSRPLTRNKGKIRRLSFDDVGFKPTKFQQELIDKIRQHRDSVYAHSDADHAIYTHALMELGSARKEGEPFRFYWTRHHPGIHFSYSEIFEIHEMLPEIMRCVADKQQDVAVECEHLIKKEPDLNRSKT